MKILGVETSCDETAIAVLEIVDENNIKILSSIISSQIKLHAKYGGIVPHLAAREHEKNLPKVLRATLKEAKIKSVNDLDLIAVTMGPGLSPALWRGINFSKELAKKYKKPIVRVNHLEGHIFSNWLPPIAEISKSEYLNPKPRTRASTVRGRQIPKFPILNLIVSGGHTMLVLMKGIGKYNLIGETRDDAAGEAFDKIARLLGLGFPGGPVIAKRAENKYKRYKNIDISFPRPMKNSPDFDFSFSGLKTAVLYKIKDLKKNKIKLTAPLVNQICAEAQEAIVEVLVSKTIKAAKKTKAHTVFLSGGVSANELLRKKLEDEVKKLKNVQFSMPEIKYTTDNAAMIALAGYFSAKGGSASGGNYKNKKADKLSALEANPNLSF